MAKEYNIRKTSGLCSVCDTQLEPGTEFTATLRGQEEELIREDFCDECWAKDPKTENEEILCIWRTKVPQPTEKKKLLVDDTLLINLFERLDGAEDESKIKFRYVLALVLMRKKILQYQSSKTNDQGQDIWNMRLRGGSFYDVVDPKLSEDEIAEVSENLSEIMEGDF